MTSFFAPSPLVLIEDKLLGAAAATLDFTGIPASFSHLMLMLQGRGDTAATFANVFCQFNGDVGANYDDQSVFGNGGVTGAAELQAQVAALIASISAGTSPAGAGSSFVLDIPNYSGVTFQKSTICRTALKLTNAAGGLQSILRAGFWRNTAAINRILLSLNAGNFAAGTRAMLYGLS